MSEIWGIPSPYKSGAQNIFTTISQLNISFNGLSSEWNVTYINGQVRCKLTRSLLHRLKTT